MSWAVTTVTGPVRRIAKPSRPSFAGARHRLRSATGSAAATAPRGAISTRTSPHRATRSKIRRFNRSAATSPPAPAVAQDAASAAMTAIMPRSGAWGSERTVCGSRSAPWFHFGLMARRTGTAKTKGPGIAARADGVLP
ncbi:hypothetical protein ACR720_10895 [Sphingomonas parapaucimobilis]|uniref:hypothetical protein n=1 Tax=Sphingomonas parapaucimobilis TaxID=28213 RepID=UPI0039E957E8